MEALELLKRRVEREVAARKLAEAIMEQKALELYYANQELRNLNGSLEQTVAERTHDYIAEQSRLRSLITNLDSGVLLEDEHRKVMLANQMFCDLFNIPVEPEMMRGLDCTQSAEVNKHLFADPAQFVRRIDELLENRQLVTDEELDLADGRVFRRTYVPIFEGNDYLGHLWRYSDVTDEVQAHETLRHSEDKYRRIIENMELGLMEVDNDGRIVLPYPRFCAMLGYDPEELRGQMATEILLPPEYLPVLQQQAVDRLAGNAGVYEVPIIKKDGNLMWAMISGAPIINIHGTVTGSIGIHYDITQQKTLYRELEESKKRAEEAQEAEKQFLANMSHEIRTPLNAIIGMAHLLIDTDPSEEQKEYLSILKNSAEMLRTLISDVLDLSKIRAGKMEAQEKEFDLVALVQTLAKSVQLRMESKSVEVKADIDPGITHLVLGDDLLLNQILLNLLGNAEKFTAEGEIGIRTKILSEPHETPMWVEFCVYDTGIGIPAEKHDLIFQTFRQVDGDTRRKFGGTGLGLAITKQLVELQGGSIRVESTLGVGTQFYINLPYLNTGVVAEQNTPIMEQMQLNSDGKRILVAEDNAMNRKYIDTLLRKWNIEHFFAHNGREAYEMCLEDHYDLVLMDIQMPEMDGYEACQAIRDLPGLNNKTPIIALTASAMLSQRDKAFFAGMNDYLSKPFKPLQLFEKICLYIDSNEIETNMPTPQEFTFDKRLDTELLETMYGDDLDYAFEMFEAFRDNVPKEFKSIQPLLDGEKWPEVARLLHKIKPSFGMVGLSELEKALEQMEQSAKNQPNKANLHTMFMQVQNLFDVGTRIIDNEYSKLKKIISNPTHTPPQ